ncbi:hypothetical protein FV219_05455 [Methylobacterium sp. WL122]|nr:hypothetical protein FV219_05455 [Methylobacterium sp. WL122]
MASPAPIRRTPSDVQGWRDALEGMKPTTAPCPGMTGARWEKMREAAIAFLDEFGDEAAALGWTTAELFGVHPTAGFIRVDHCGALMISGERVRAIEPDKIRFGMTTYYRNLPGRPVGVPVWEVVR